MYARTEPSAVTSPYRSPRWRPVVYWLATAAVAGELGLGGIWDIARRRMGRQTPTASPATKPAPRRASHTVSQ